MATYICLTREGAEESDLRELADRITALGGTLETRSAGGRTLLITKADSAVVLEAELTRSAQVARIFDGDRPHPLAGRKAYPERTVVDIGGVRIGGGRPVLIAGPCSAENPDVLMEAAAAVKASGASMLRVGIFKPRTSPYSYQGLGRDGLSALRDARQEFGLPIVSEVMSVRDLDAVADSVDLMQVGARNMQNYSLLVEIGRTGRPVLLKRGMAATVADWLNAAEYLLAYGCRDVVLCERGIRTFERTTRFTLDLNAVPVVKELSHLPVIVDPSHGTGASRYVAPMSAAAIAAGADGLIVEVHPRPDEALSDGDQSLDFEQFHALSAHVGRIAGALDTGLAAAPESLMAGSLPTRNGRAHD
ncbi:3-deoxy-7-phosphoheptulonate synthase [Amycolatopsis roodepoortensis]|uniref:3-deoxy-7-phosphoheptulonate synthase n=1 Tax=Amycolatopsis roodepoortensis TaxID=700274 RepID=UPI00214C48FD|nr:3-deoxy-7-phosphoheptulonate synthase [Amycolatopsis roodepoortensis]UUV31540.1 3-deoxy-7-phosphoheptulonate synthase [Amycolatopsis roodepoortensis]